MSCGIDRVRDRLFAFLARLAVSFISMFNVNFDFQLSFSIFHDVLEIHLTLHTHYARGRVARETTRHPQRVEDL